MHETRETGDALRVRAGLGQKGRDVDAIAHRQARHPFAERLDHTCAVATRRVRQFRQPRVLARAHIGLDGIHTSGVKPHDDLAGGRTRVVDLGHPQHLGAPELLNSNRAHSGSIGRVALAQAFALPYCWRHGNTARSRASPLGIPSGCRDFRGSLNLLTRLRTAPVAPDVVWRLRRRRRGDRRGAAGRTRHQDFQGSVRTSCPPCGRQPWSDGF